MIVPYSKEEVGYCIDYIKEDREIFEDLKIEYTKDPKEALSVAMCIMDYGHENTKEALDTIFKGLK